MATTNPPTLSQQAQEKLKDFHEHNKQDNIGQVQANRLEQAITSSPFLTKKVNDAISKDSIQQLQEELDPHSNGSYLPDEKILSLQPSLLNGDLDDLTFVTAHEIRHSLDSLKQHDDAIEARISEKAKQTGVRDYTDEIKDDLIFYRKAEALAQIDGFNAVVDRIKQSNPNPTLTDIYSAFSSKYHIKDFIDENQNLITGKNTYTLKPNLELNPDMTMPESTKNIEGMGKNFFDKTGFYAVDYPDQYAVYTINTAIQHEQAIHGANAKINLNLDELNKIGVDEPSLRKIMGVNFQYINDISPSKINQIQPAPQNNSHQQGIPQNNFNQPSTPVNSSVPVISHKAQKLAEQCEEKLVAFCEKHGITADSPQDFKNISMALTAEGIKKNMNKIGQLDMDMKTCELFILSYEPHLKFASVFANEVANIPVQKSMEKIQQVEQQQEQQRQQSQSQQQSYGGRSL